MHDDGSKSADLPDGGVRIGRRRPSMSKHKTVSWQALLDQAKRLGTLDPEPEGFYSHSSCTTEFYPIHPDSRLYLTAMGHGKDARFASIFRGVWESIPPTDRSSMLEYWRPWERIPGVLGACIKLEFLYRMLDEETMAVAKGGGSELRFLAPLVDRLPKKHVEALIAHELAHVLQGSKGTLTAHSLPEVWTDDMVQELASECGRTVDEMKRLLTHMSDPGERDADMIAHRWGYNAPAMRRWVHRHIRWDELIVQRKELDLTPHRGSG
jgi:hypothetical protein